MKIITLSVQQKESLMTVVTNFGMLQHMYPRGLLRGEILFAIDHMNEVLRHELLRMISWYVRY